VTDPPRYRGTVASFDAQAGLGTVGDGHTTVPFHCTQIADGSRDIPVGVAVEYVMVAGHGGRWEAASVRRL